jgi:hypothetical protein
MLEVGEVEIACEVKESWINRCGESRLALSM